MEDWDEGKTLIRTTRGTASTPAAAVLRQAHFVRYADAQGAPQRLRLGTSPVHVGRRAPCELVLADAEISSRHCVLSLQGDELRVADLGSTNGSFIEGVRLGNAAVRWPPGTALQLGRTVLHHELRDEAELMRAAELDRELERARSYLHSLLPAPVHEGPLRLDWVFEPCSRVAGDAFGWLALGPGRTAVWLFDVSGHGVGAAMHAVAVLNTLRQRTLPGADFASPATVLAALNALFQSEHHDGMFLTAWYGVFDSSAARLAYASAGHHPAYLCRAGLDDPLALHTRAPAIGAFAEARYSAADTPWLPGDRLVLFSDGVFEQPTLTGEPLGLAGLLPLLAAAAPASPKPASAVNFPHEGVASALAHRIRGLTPPAPLEDDFSLLVLQAAA